MNRVDGGAAKLPYPTIPEVKTILDNNFKNSWSDLKGKLDYKTDHEKKVISEMARMVNSIVRRRKALGLTQREVAERAGITQAQVARLENSTSVPSMETVMKVAIALDLSIGFKEAEEEQSAARLVHT
ncbi:helix-turn-helix domain-containing protein [Paenibacillus terreus]|uniref:Helix-turn-helix domain-containing protein n=1 Tax=Paenibacillus terreus TaxID=1387834 RepID=A0ABV5B7Q5_9BACL